MQGLNTTCLSDLKGDFISRLLLRTSSLCYPKITLCQAWVEAKFPPMVWSENPGRSDVRAEVWLSDESPSLCRWGACFGFLPANKIRSAIDLWSSPKCLHFFWLNPGILTHKLSYCPTFFKAKKTNYTTSGILEELEWLPPQGSQTLKFQDFGLSKVQFFILQSPLSKSCMSHESLACLMWSSCIHSGLEFHPDPAITKNAMPSLPSPQVLRLRNKQQIQRARAEVTSVDISDILEFCLRTGDLEDHLAVVLLLSLLFQNLQRNHTRTANPQQQQQRKKNRK